MSGDEDLARVQDEADRLREHNERLMSVVRDARQQLIELKEVVDGLTKSEAIGEALNYTVTAIHMKVASIRQAISRNVVGTEADNAHGFPDAAYVALFETALRSHGFQVVPVTDGGAS